MLKIAVIGAGKTGRGFIGRLLKEANTQIMFVDKDETLVNKLNAQKSFSVSFFGNKREKITVDNYFATNWENSDFSDVELIIVSVGGTNLTDVGNKLREKINDGKTRYIITAENAKHPAKTLKEALNTEINIAEAAVFCTTIENGELDINSENYPYLQYDADNLKYISPIPQLKPVKGFNNFLTRKLFTYNAASCIIAYLGYIKGYTDYGEAANDKEILKLLDINYAETNRVLCSVFGYTKEDQEEFAALSKLKFCDRTIIDTVARNAREPQRKLQSGERILGPLVLLDENGADTSVLILTAAAMLLYTADGETEWEAIKTANSPRQILEKISGLKCGGKLSEKIIEKRYELIEYLNKKDKLPL